MVKRNIYKINQAMGLQRSPTNKQKLGQANNESPVNNTKTSPGLGVVKASEDVNYTTWMGEHPSALRSFDQMMKAAKGKKIIVFLDYDGTLSPIVDDPNLAFMSEEMRAAVREVAKCFPTAIISGRSIDKVKDFVQLSNVYYAGSHGMDIMAPPRPVKSCDGHSPTLVMDKKGTEVLFQPAKRFLPTIEKILKELEEETAKVKGARVEDNRFCVSVHFRQVDDEDYPSLEEKVKSVLAKYADFHLCWGKKVMEIRPTIEWDKGHAVEYFLETLGLSNSDVIPVYIGDDRTDEDAFKVIQQRGTGYPIIVTSCPKETKASHSLVDPSEVLTFLLRLARWRKSSSSSRSLNQIWGVVN
ncbi:Probable trehalose-phosphate phosphatase 4 [Linum grandiflorum]